MYKFYSWLLTWSLALDLTWSLTGIILSTSWNLIWNLFINWYDFTLYNMTIVVVAYTHVVTHTLRAMRRYK